MLDTQRGQDVPPRVVSTSSRVIQLEVRSHLMIHDQAYYQYICILPWDIYVDQVQNLNHLLLKPCFL